ncbi:MAG: RDD family protein [Deltaproteobacteria bacterium]|nr:RDD family protein [Deltaproteobacteria bacterium]
MGSEVNLETQHGDRIKLKPLSEGLGLSHFADGLPYAPQRRTRPPVHFNFPQPRQPRSAQAETEQPEMLQPEATPPVESAAMRAFELRYAGFARRAFAYAIDVSASAALFAAIAWGSFRINGYSLVSALEGADGFQMLLPLFLLYLVVYLGYFLIQETTWRSTIGKALFGISIRSASGFSTVGRALCFFVAALPFGIGLLWYFFDPKRRCWHDLITESEVVLR